MEIYIYSYSLVRKREEERKRKRKRDGGLLFEHRTWGTEIRTTSLVEWEKGGTQAPPRSPSGGRAC